MEPFVALIRRYCIDYTARHDLSVCDDVMAPGYTLHMGTHDLAGRDEAYKPAAAAQFRQFPGLCLTVNEIVCSGGRLALRFTEHGASARHDGARAAWGGIGLYRWDGPLTGEDPRFAGGGEAMLHLAGVVGVAGGQAADLDLLSPELTEDPYAYFAGLRATDPVHWAEANKAWLLTRYDDVVAAYADPPAVLRPGPPAARRAASGAARRVRADAGDHRPLDGGHRPAGPHPPAHTRLRKLANRAFRQQRVNAMGDWIGELVDELIADFLASGREDFLNDIAYPLPAAVIARMMGAPQQDRGKFQHWSDELALVAFSAGGEDRAARYVRALAGVRDLQEYLAHLIARRRREPGEDMISLLLSGSDAGGDQLDDADLMALHVGFGRGIHACLGAQLASIEARVALPKILGRAEGRPCLR